MKMKEWNIEKMRFFILSAGWSAGSAVANVEILDK